MTSADVETTAWSKPELKLIKASILTLAVASGNASIKDEADKDSSLYDIMQRYCTGTQQAKEWNRPGDVPTMDELGPIVTHLPLDTPDHSR